MAFAGSNIQVGRRIPVYYQQASGMTERRIADAIAYDGRFSVSTLGYPYEYGLGSWLSKIIPKPVKKVVKAVTNVVTAPIKATGRLLKGDIKGALGYTVAPWASSEATRGRILRRAGGVVTGAVTGFVTGGGPIGAIAGGLTGGLMAKQGVKGIKGYGKIALTAGVVSGAASIATGALAQAGYGTGLVSQQTAQSAILASGKLGMVGTGISAGAPIGAAMQMAPVTSAIAKGVGVVGKGVSFVGAKTVAGVTALAPTVMGMIKPKAIEQPTETVTGEQFNDMLRTTSAVGGSYMTGNMMSQPVLAPSQSMLSPSYTGAMLPGQEYPPGIEPEGYPEIAKAGLLPEFLDPKTVLIMTGVGLGVLLLSKLTSTTSTRRRR